MELKVWVEGIQRVVCGVSDATTCQDVVIALAHATGKTGRFTLIEKWRDTERLLAPADYPLKSLHKWGEYSSEVVFVLRHSEKHRKERSSKRTEKFLHNFSPHSAPNDSTTTTPTTKGIKKSLTFSGAHSHPKNHLTSGAARRHLIQDNHSLDSIDDQSSVTSHSSISTMSPYSSLEKRGHRQRLALPHLNNNKPCFSSLEKHKKKAHRLKSPSPYNNASGRLTQPSPKCDQLNSESHSPHELTPKIEQVEEYDLDKHLTDNAKTNGAVPKHRPPGSVDFTKLNGNVGKDTEFREKSPSKEDSTKTPPVSPLAEKDDLAKLIKLQQEKLSVQASQIKSLDSEIQFWEARDRDCDRLEAQTAAELDTVQKRDVEVDNELQELDLVSWADKLEIEKQNQKTLQSEITLLRSRLANCESELLQTKNKSLRLNEEVEAEKKELAKQERERKDQEMKVLQEISEVQKQLNEKLAENGKNQDNIEGLQEEMKSVESSIFERKTQLADCEKQLRHVNMEVFMKVPNSLEGSSSALNRNAPSRPGSARKMRYSPMFLKEAVATTTNPHGLWV